MQFDEMTGLERLHVTATQLEFRARIAELERYIADAEANATDLLQAIQGFEAEVAPFHRGEVAFDDAGEQARTEGHVAVWEARIEQLKAQYGQTAYAIAYARAHVAKLKRENDAVLWERTVALARAGAL